MYGLGLAAIRKIFWLVAHDPHLTTNYGLRRVQRRGRALSSLRLRINNLFFFFVALTTKKSQNLQLQFSAPDMLVALGNALTGTQNLAP